MMWALLALGTAVFYALHGAWSKRVSGRIGPLLAGWSLFSFAFPFLVAYLVVQGFPEIGGRFWPVWAVNAVLNVGASYLFLSALRLGDLGITFPLLALTPIFVVPVEWVLLGGTPGPWGAVGILLVVSGVYLLNFGERRAGILAPLGAIGRDPGGVRMLGVAVIWSVTGTLDRVAVLESSPAFYGVMLSSGVALLFLPLIWLGVRGETFPGTGGRASTEPRSGGGWLAGSARLLAPAGRGALLLHGLLFAAMFILQMEALNLALASYVLSIKRAGAILAVLLGYAAFREGALGQRLAGTVVTVTGACVLVLWG